MTKIGQINFVDVTVDRATDTVLVRADIPNPTDVLIDGQLVRVEVETRHAARKRSSIPQAALIADQQGVYVFVVEDGKAAIRRIKTGGESRADIVIDSGPVGRASWSSSRACRACAPARRVRATPMPEPPTGAEPMLSSIFVDRPRLAIVIAIVTTIAGLLSLFAIPVAQYPDIVPPQVSVTTTYPGANRRRRRRHRRPADRGAGRRRRQDDVHEERQRR